MSLGRREFVNISVVLELSAHCAVLEDSFGVEAEGFHLVSISSEVANCGFERLVEGILRLPGESEHISGTNVGKQEEQC